MVREGGVNIANLFDIAIVAHDQILYTMGHIYLRKNSIVAHDQISCAMGKQLLIWYNHCSTWSGDMYTGGNIY